MAMSIVPSLKINIACRLVSTSHGGADRWKFVGRGLFRSQPTILKREEADDEKES